MQYNETIQSLITPDAFEHYGTSDIGTSAMSPSLHGLTEEDLFPNGCADTDMATCCLSGLWLLHNFLHEGHELCQNLSTGEASHWHAIMHRTEGDYRNAKYWYRQAQTKLSDAISAKARQPFSSDQIVDGIQRDGIGRWQTLAVAEWQVLFDQCYSVANPDLNAI